MADDADGCLVGIIGRRFGICRVCEQKRRRDKRKPAKTAIEIQDYCSHTLRPLHWRDNGLAANPPYAGVNRIRFSGSWAAAHLSAAQ